MPRVVWADESKTVSDFKLDLVMTTFQQRPNVQLSDNPAVVDFELNLNSKASI